MLQALFHLWLLFFPQGYWYPPFQSGSVASNPVVTINPTSSTRTDGPYCAGMEIVVGSSPITVTDLGRFDLAGNNQSHTVYLYAESGSNTGTLLATSTVAMIGSGAYVYASVTPVILSASTNYYFLVQEQASLDAWYDAWTPTLTSAATDFQNIYITGTMCSGTVLDGGNLGQTFSSPNFKYHL